jgi:hypothetical protein
MATLAELVSLTIWMNEISERAHQRLAARPTVTGHLGQARRHLTQPRRTVAHAEGMLAYNVAVSG